MLSHPLHSTINKTPAPTHYSANPNPEPPIWNLEPKKMISSPIPEALTFDDVLLVPAYSEVVPTQVSTQAQLTRAITLNTPLISGRHGHGHRVAPGHRHGPAGGMGVVHRNLTIAQQAGEIDKSQALANPA